MDNRTGFRRRGPAFLADEARRALGVALEPRPLAEIPPPLVHTAFGVAVCAVAVLVRPEALGLARSAMASAALAVVTAVVLGAYDAAVYPRERRPGLDTLALPVAAVAAFATVLAGVSQLGIRIAAGLVAALVVGGVPQLVGRQAAGRSGFAGRLLRDLAGAAVLAPALVAAASPLLAVAPRLALAAAVAFLVSFDALRTEHLGGGRSVTVALAVAVVLGAAAYLVGPSSATAGLRAAALLVLWYGLRGIGGSLAMPTVRRGALVVAEHTVFVAVAAAALRWVAVHP